MQQEDVRTGEPQLLRKIGESRTLMAYDSLERDA
jgi:hypothetical protein